MNIAHNQNPEIQNNFDGKFARNEFNYANGVEAILHPGEVITATKPIEGFTIGGAPVMAMVDLGESGRLSIIKIDMDDPKFDPLWGGQLHVDKHKHTLAKKSLLAVWNDGSNYELYTDELALAGDYLSGRDSIKGGAKGTDFYRWGDNGRHGERNPLHLPEHIPSDFISLNRNKDGSVTVKALSDAKEVKVHVATDRQHQELLGEKWAGEIEAARNPKFKKLAEWSGKITKKLVDKSYRSK